MGFLDFPQLHPTHRGGNKERQNDKMAVRLVKSEERQVQTKHKTDAYGVEELKGATLNSPNFMY